MPENYVKNKNLHWSLDFKGCLSNGSIAELYGSVNFPQAQLLPSDPLSHDLSETHVRWLWYGGFGGSVGNGAYCQVW